MSVYAGVDAGGSRTRGVLIDEGGAELARAEAGPSGFQDRGAPAAARAIEDLLSRLAGSLAGSSERPARLVCAMAGAGHREAAAELQKRLTAAGLAGEVAIVSDAEAALHGAFGSGPGIVLIAGTGSIAVGRASDGRTARAGGTRPAGGDPGSADWIGREAIRIGLAAAPEGDPEPASRREAVARVALGIGEAVQRGDAAAAALQGRAVEALIELVLEVSARLAPWPGPPPRLALAGGLLAPGRALRAAVSTAIDRSSRGIEVVQDPVDGALGAARLALRGGFAPRQEP